MNNEKKSGEIMAKWDKAMLEGNVSAMQNSVEQVVRILKDGIMNKQYENLHFLFENGAERIEAWGNLLGIDSDTDCCKVFTYAVFWMAQRISEGIYESSLLEEQIQSKSEEVKQLRKSKYFYPMLTLLEKNGELPQGIIAQHLSVSTHSLSNFLRRNERYGLWEHIKYGKYNYYHLTDQGKSYLTLYHKQELLKDNTDLSSVFVSFMNCLADEIGESVPSVENIIHRINKKFGSERAVFGSESDKIAVRRVVRKINFYARRRERESSLGFEGTYGFYENTDVTAAIIDIGENNYNIVDNYYSGMQKGGIL